MPTLEWIGKKAVLNHHNEIPFRLLKCNPELSVGDPGSGNLLVQGDNLEALKALLPYYAGKVKCIYIDPPYNTGNEKWVYNDAVNSPEMRHWLNHVVGGESEDLSRHDKWLCMMYPRLMLLKEFLREDGVIFISIDDIEVAFLRLVLDEIFGRNRFIGCFIWKSRQQRDNRNVTGASIDHEYVFCYGNRIRGANRDRSMYSNPDNDPRGDWSSSNMVGLATKTARPNLHYDLIHPTTGVNYGCPSKGWRYDPDTMARLASEDKILWPKSSTGRPRRKYFFSELIEEFTGYSSIIGEEIFTRHGTQDILDILSKVDFTFPKPTALISELLSQSTDATSLVLDSFAGSGTTGHAVLKLNKADGGNRRFILVEIERDISRRVTAQRLKNAISGYQVNTGTGDKKSIAPLGGGFRYCELGPTLFDSDGKIRREVTFRELANHVFFTETGEPLPDGKSNSPLIGVSNDSAVYLLYNGILKDKSPGGGNVLTNKTLNILPPYTGRRIIYGTACRLSPRRLSAENITFRQIPYQVKVR